MNANILLSIIFCFQNALCTLPNFSELCKHGSAEEVLAKLKANSSDPNIHAQLCFNEAVGASNFAVLTVLPQHYAIAPASLLRMEISEESAIILLSSNWLFNEQMISGQKLFTYHLNHVLALLAPGDSIAVVFTTAARLGYLDIIKALVSGRHVNPSRANLDIALISAADHGNFDIVRYILGLNAADKDWLNDKYLWACTCAYGLDLVKILVEDFGIDLNVYDGIAVLEVTRSGNVDLLEYLITKGLNLTGKINDALVQACQSGRIEMTEYLLKSKGADPAMNDNNLLLLSSSSNQHLIIDVLLRDQRVYGALNGQAVDWVLGGYISDDAKMILLYWIANKMKEVDMKWISIYKRRRLTDPESATEFKAVKDRKVAELRANGFSRIATFILVWADALENFATLTLLTLGDAKEAGEERLGHIVDTFDSFLCYSLPDHFEA